MNDEQAIRQVSSRLVYRNQWMSLREDEIERLDGVRGIYAVIDKPDFALVIPAERDGFHLVEEYRYPVGRRSWSFPQGAFPAGEDGSPEELARLELAQETGLRAATMTPLGFLNSAHGTIRQGFHAFLAEDLEQGEPDREPEEQDMCQRFVTRAEFRQMIRDGAITDDSTVAAYTLLMLHDQQH